MKASIAVPSILKVGKSFTTALGVRKITRVTQRLVYTTNDQGQDERKENIKDVSVKINDGFWQLVQPKVKKSDIKLTKHEEIVLEQIKKHNTIIRNEMVKMRCFAKIKSCRGAADSLAKKGLVKKVKLKEPKVAGKFQIAFAAK